MINFLEILIKAIEVIYKFFKERKGIIVEWREPDWFKLSVGLYSYFTPQEINLWLQVYFCNTTTKPQIIQSARAEIINTDLLSWHVNNYAPQPKLELEGVGYHFPITVEREDSLPTFFLLRFNINHQEPEQFIEEFYRIPDPILLRIIYETKEGSKTKEKILERELDLRDEFKKVYKQFLESELQSGNNLFLLSPNLEQREILLNLKKWIKLL